MLRDDMDDFNYCICCGRRLPDGADYCPTCGADIDQQGAQSTRPQINITINNINNAPVVIKRKKNKWTAFLLCLFLGFFGVHRFYEGKVATGILYLLTVGLAGFGWLIDCIILLTKPNPYYV